MGIRSLSILSGQNAVFNGNVKKGEKISKIFDEMGNFDENGKVKDISLEIVGDERHCTAGKKKNCTG